MVLHRHKKPLPQLFVKAVESANVRFVDSKGKVSKDLHFVGKKHNPETYQADVDAQGRPQSLVTLMDWEVLPEGEKFTTSHHILAHYVNEIKQGHLIPLDAETASYAGQSFSNKAE